MHKEKKRKKETGMSILHDGLLSNLKVTGVLTAGRVVGREMFLNGAVPNRVLVGTTHGIDSLPSGTAGQILTSTGSGSIPQWENIAAGGVTSVTGGNNVTVTGTTADPVVNVSGTTNHSVLLGNAAGAINSLTNGSTGQVLTAQTGADPVWATASGVTSITGGNNITLTGTAANPIVNVSGTVNNTVLLGNATNSITSLTNGSVGQVLTATAGTPAWTSNVANIQGDSGGALNAATVSILSGAGVFANNTLSFVGSGGNTLRINTSNASSNTVIGLNSISTGTGAVSIGNGCSTSGTGVAFGRSATSAGGIALGSNVVAGARGIAIGGEGVSAGNNQIKIGFFDDGNPVSAFIDGANHEIVGGTALTVDLATQEIGVAASAQRYKENIQPLDHKVSKKIYDLKVVSFNYKKDEKKQTQYGLIAEDVAQILPELVAYKKGGIIETVRYDLLPALLLAEIQELRTELTELRQKLFNK